MRPVTQIEQRETRSWRTRPVGRRRRFQWRFPAVPVDFRRRPVDPRRPVAQNPSDPRPMPVEPVRKTRSSRSDFPASFPATASGVFWRICWGKSPRCKSYNFVDQIVDCWIRVWNYWGFSMIVSTVAMGIELSVVDLSFG